MKRNTKENANAQIKRGVKALAFFFQLLDPPKPEEKPTVVPSSGRACRYGNACTRPDCKFRHDRDAASEDGYGNFSVRTINSFPSRKIFDISCIFRLRGILSEQKVTPC